MARPGSMVSVSVRGAAAAALLALAVVLAACGEGDEEVAPAQTTADTTPAGTPAAAATPSSMATTPAASGMLTYVDPTYGYSFEYPAVWHLFPAKGAGEVTTLYSYDPARVRPEDAGKPVPTSKLKVEFLVLENPEGLSLEEWVAEDRKRGAPVEVVSRSSVTADATAGIAEVIQHPDGSTAQYFFSKPGRIYLINKYPSDSVLSSEFDGLLTSFLFEAQ